MRYLILGILLIGTLAGCKKNYDGVYVANKDEFKSLMNAVIAENGNPLVTALGSKMIDGLIEAENFLIVRNDSITFVSDMMGFKYDSNPISISNDTISYYGSTDSLIHLTVKDNRIFTSLNGYIIGYDKIDDVDRYYTLAEGIRKDVEEKAKIRKAKEVEKARIQEILSSSISIKMIDKVVSQPRYGLDKLYTSYEFQNESGKVIEAFQGTITIKDNLKNKLETFRIKNNEGIPADELINKNYETSYYSFSDDHKTIKDSEINKLKVEFVAEKILFSGEELIEDNIISGDNPMSLF